MKQVAALAMLATIAGCAPHSITPTSIPPATIPPATIPPATIPPATIPPATIPPATIPPAAIPPAAIPIVMRVVDYDICNGKMTAAARVIAIEIDGRNAATISVPCNAAAGQQHPPTFDSPQLALSVGTHHIVATDNVSGVRAEHDIVLTAPPPTSAFDSWFTVEVSASATSLQVSDPASASLKS